MKFGILTYHNIPNFGAILQAQSLCQFIRNSGYICDIIDYTCKNIVDRELVFHPSTNPIKNLLLKLAWRKNIIKINECNNYIQGLNILSTNKYNRQNIALANMEYDAFISGADMIWNIDVNGNDFSYFLDFADNHKFRISFASSIGKTLNEKEKEMLFPMLRKYDSISVREYDTNQMLNNAGIHSQHLYDPTILIDPKEWIDFSTSPEVSNYVLVYFPTAELIQKAKQYAKEHSLKVVVISQGVPRFDIIKVSPNNPTEWIGLFANASAVLTNSFHGFLFSLYFEKPVWTANYSNRLTSILEALNLQRCRLDIDKELSNQIDYLNCNKLMAKIRVESQLYIKRTLSKFSI